MSNNNFSDLDVVLHQPLRTRIAAYLSSREEATFTELKKLLEVTDGNLEAHIKKLRAAEYIVTHKVKGEGRAQTFYHLTELGKAEFKKYVNQLQSLLDI